MNDAGAGTGAGDDEHARLHAYVDDELSDDEREAFEAHLARCEQCGDELPALLAMTAALDGVAAHAASAVSPLMDAPAVPSVAAPRFKVIPGGLDPRAAAEPAVIAPAPAVIAAPASVPAPHRRWPIAVVGLAVAAAAVFLLIPRGQLATREPPVVASLAGDLRSTRGLEARLSYPGADTYRAVDVARGAATPEAISFDRLAGLERAKNWHGLAVASLLAGEKARAAQSFEQAPHTPEVDSDRAALELLDGSQAALDRALDDVDRSLAAAPNRGAAHWNRALVLAGMNLPLAAAREFDRVAMLGESGWTEEARTRAQLLRSQVAQRRTRWQQTFAEGQRLLADGTSPTELSVTGYVTLILYDAARSAPSRARAEALLPMAQTLDAAYHTDRLTKYVRQVAASDFAVRRPLAERYHAAITTGADLAPLLAQLAKPSASDDIWLGAIVRAGEVGAHLDDYRRRAAATADPWFAIIAEHETAKAELAAGKTAAAERRLRDALVVARRERLAYRALMLETELVALHSRARELADANADAIAAFRDATAAGTELIAMNTLAELAAINQDRYAYGPTRAYVEELIERSQSSPATGPSPFDDAHDCATRHYAFHSLADLSLTLFAPARARAEADQAPHCNVDPATEDALTMRSALIRSELYRFDRRDDDRSKAQAALAALHASPRLTVAQRAFVAYIDGNLAIEDDRGAGQRALRDAVTRAGHDTDPDGFLAKARAYSLTTLALDAGQHGEYAGVLATLGETLEVPVPERCAVAIVVAGPRSAVAIADAQGAIAGEFVGARTAEPDVTQLISPALAGRLAACDKISVLARAPVLGAGRLLPPQLAWSYALKPPAAATPPSATRLVVANPDAPADLQLPPLGAYPEEPGATVLRGADATPTRVLAAMRDAGEIEFHTHGFIANDVFEASYLVLTPELDHQYALTAADVAQVTLTGAPLVILGACHAATSSRSLEGGRGLAEALLRAGARAVIASPDAVQDLGAHDFFARVRDAVRRGVDPAIAVRDERQRRRATSHDDSWVAGVVVFE